MNIAIHDRAAHLRQIEDSVRADLLKRYSSVIYDLGMSLIVAAGRLGAGGDSNPEFSDKLKRQIYTALTSDVLPYEFADYFWQYASDEQDYYSHEIDEMAGKVKRHFESIVAQGMEV